MTPSETALAICQKYGMVTYDTDFNEGLALPLDIAKKCALIDVEGKIKELKSLEKYWRNDAIDPVNYWQYVEKEINQL